MKKWRNLAPPDDPESYYDVDALWPTNRGSYESADFLTGTSYTATGTNGPICAWRAKTTATNTVNPRYVVDGNGKLWRFDSASAGTELADKTGTASFGNTIRAQFAQYGSVTIAVLGSTRSAAVTGGATIFTTAPNTNFAALAGAPAGESIAIVSNAVLVTNTSDKDGWAASDVGDYTNWSTNEAASGRIFFPAGPILSLVEWNGAGYAFKNNSIHRLRYVGGAVKWLIEKVWEGVGCGDYNTARAGSSGILFAGYSKTDAGSPTTPIYWYDGANEPVQVNPMTEIPAPASSGDMRIVYHPAKDRFTIWNGSSGCWYFSPRDMAFGKNASPLGAGTTGYVPYEGNVLAGDGDSITTSCWATGAANAMKLYATATNVGSCYVETTKVGKVNRKTQYNRVTNILRRRVSAGTPTAILSISFFREREDTSASSTRANIAEGTERRRFDLLNAAAVDNFARFKTVYTDLDVEIDDSVVDSKDVGAN